MDELSELMAERGATRALIAHWAALDAAEYEAVATGFAEDGVWHRQGEALKGPPWATKKVIAKAKKADVATLERAICVFADLEVELRGGGDVRVDEDAAFSVALARAAG